MQQTTHDADVQVSHFMVDVGCQTEEVNTTPVGTSSDDPEVGVKPEYRKSVHYQEKAGNIYSGY